MAGILAFDTSNYTTSAACLQATTGRGANVSRLLPVAPGKLGLRQSDAVFAHVKALPAVVAELAARAEYEEPDVFAASVSPRAAEGSYMPCFLVGEGMARAMASAHGAPFYAFSHQQGHIAAAAWSADSLALLHTPFLAWHLSGGTTELLLVRPDREQLICEEVLGGTTDISAGQLIDRAGVLLGLGFPAGKALASLASEHPTDDGYRVRCANCMFSLSGMENRVKDMHMTGRTAYEIANFVLNTILSAIERATEQALLQYPNIPVLCSGGVASNERVRRCMAQRFGAVFARPEFSTDNAMGVAVLAAIKKEGRLPEWTLE